MKNIDLTQFQNIGSILDNKKLLDIYNIVVETEPLKFKILKKFKCKGCGWCCKAQSPMLIQKDIQKLCYRLDCSKKELYDKYIDKDKKIPYLKSPCPFLDKDNRCTVYGARPHVCKIFPFVDFLLVIDPCLIGKDIVNVMAESKVFTFSEEGNDEHRQYLQELYDDRVNVLSSIADTNKSKGSEYKSMFVDKEILIKLIKILKSGEENGHITGVG